MMHYVVDIAEAWKKVQMSANGAAGAADRAQGYAGMAEGAYGMAQSMGWLDAGGGVSQWGGKIEGNYANQGAAVGAVVGTIIGGIVGSIIPGVGTVIGMQVGAALGKVIGGVIGKAIKTGADEGLVTLNLVAGQIEAKITKNEAGLGGVLKGVAADINDSVQGILASFGGSLEGISGMQLKIRGKNVRVFVNGLIGEFQDMAKAMDFAVAQLLQTASFSGVSKNMEAVLPAARFDTVEELQNIVEFVNGLERAASGTTDLAAEMNNFAARMVNAQGQLERFGIAAGEACRLRSAYDSEQWVTTQNIVLTSSR